MYICDYLATFSDSETSSSSDRADDHAHDEDGFLAIEGKPGLYYRATARDVITHRNQCKLHFRMASVHHSSSMAHNSSHSHSSSRISV